MVVSAWKANANYSQLQIAPHIGQGLCACLVRHDNVLKSRFDLANTDPDFFWMEKDAPDEKGQDPFSGLLSYVCTSPLGAQANRAR
jgi:hypothetical protein